LLRCEVSFIHHFGFILILEYNRIATKLFTQQLENEPEEQQVEDEGEGQVEENN